MFEWLEEEIAAIRTPRFHVVDGPASAAFAETVTRSSLPLPSSYREFVLKFGNARLYRDSGHDWYRIGVFAGPRLARVDDGACLYHLGFHDGASVYVKSRDTSIFEFESESEEKVAEDFDEWLGAACTRARKRFGQEKWAEILRGPAPFTPAELDLVQARRLFRWRVIGIDKFGDHMFEVTNSSARTLPVLTIGLRSRDRSLNGAIRLKVADVRPGQTAVVRAPCYKELKPPSEIEAFELPDPGPEDREFFRELHAE